MSTTLGATELALLTRAIERVGEVTDPSTFPETALRAAFSLVPCAVASYNEVLPDGGSHAFWFPAAAAMDARDATAVLDRHLHEHPVVTEIIRTGDGSPRAISDFLTADEFRALNLFRELFGPMGLEDQLSIALPAPRPLVIGIALNRELRGFDARDRTMIGLLRPYLVQAHRSAHLAARVEAAAAIGLRSRAGLLVLSDGRVEALAGALPEWLPADRLFPGGRLDPVALAWFDSQRAGRGATGTRSFEPTDLPPLTRPLIRAIEDTRWTFRRVEAAIGPVLVVTRGSGEADRPRPVLRAMGLTDREAEVLELVISGRSNPEIAGSLAIARSTVKRHLEAIYRKFGVRSRAQAVALAIDTFTQR